eukprot:COSAG06_NODE_10245_length_1720_cov_1.980876_1_plen_102_part_00
MIWLRGKLRYCMVWVRISVSGKKKYGIHFAFHNIGGSLTSALPVDPTTAAELPDVSPGTVTAFATTHADGSQAGLQGLQVFVTNFSPTILQQLQLFVCLQH